MKLIILNDYNAVSEYAANYVAKRIKEFAPTTERKFVLGLPTGSSPIGAYKRLVALHHAKELSFAPVVTVNMDEYIGLSADHPQSYHAFISVKCAHPNGMAEDLEECRRYERVIANAGGIELFLAGIGSDGHIAFNEPGTSLHSQTHVQALAAETIEANSRFFDSCPDKVYVRMIGRPEDFTSGTTNKSEQLDVSELRKQKRKANKVKAQEEKSKQCTSSPPVTLANKRKIDGELDVIEPEPLDPQKLLNVRDSLEEAVKFIQPVLRFPCADAEAYLVAFNVYWHRNKILLMLQCLTRAKALEPMHPALAEAVTRFLTKCPTPFFGEKQ